MIFKTKMHVIASGMGLIAMPWESKMVHQPVVTPDVIILVPGYEYDMCRLAHAI